ncbi:hypothetical protein DFA_11667 [Cavenderia fasciculata]|uniref:Thioredoxin domain-containing protein n=1 Tax=Cavenderia fasciculata TaxID=261658 RepID=F4QDV9_CACFS|nr:uncharacterized protein DFA_11667 [Cavenderia fasciculata]EGG13906.1 hypothetical protein DFA_11667 [Cavenderia fasciculata]|eukprot:XP_004350614.1 hypothetical protein DFA_11667 [Cavenderia fasciculata]
MTTQTPNGFIPLTHKSQMDYVLLNCPSNQLVVFYFTYPYCSPCNSILSRLSQWTTLFPTINFYHINLDQNTKSHIAASFISSCPTIQVFQDYIDINTFISMRTSSNPNDYEYDFNLLLEERV